MPLGFAPEQGRPNFRDRSAAGMRNRADKGLPFGGYVPYGYVAIVQPVARRSGEGVRVGPALDPLTAPRVVWRFEPPADRWRKRRLARAVAAQGRPTARTT